MAEENLNNEEKPIKESPAEETQKDEAKAKGGFARADALSAEQRREIAQKAAKARWSQEVAIATHDGEIRIGEISIPCAVLEDGTRVVSQRGFTTAIGGSKPSGRRRSGDEQLPTIMTATNLKPFIDEDLIATAIPIPYRPKNGGSIALGVPAAAIPKMCKVWVKAHRKGKLKSTQYHIADQAEILMDGFSELGIIALIDEATGFQEVRDRFALQEILDTYLRKEFASWAKRFPDDFYKEIFRLRGWKWQGMKVNRPQCVAKYTTDIVYSRVAPGILAELESRNPMQENGRRKSTHHQWLTEDVGHVRLAEHLYGVIGLMRGFGDGEWNQFKKMLDRSYPKRNNSLQRTLFEND